MIDITNRIETHLILSDVEVSPYGLRLGFNECMNINQRIYKRLAIRKIKCEISENPGYPFALDIVYYDRSTGGSHMYFLNFRLNLTTQKPIEIAVEIVNQLNAKIESINKTSRVDMMNYDDSMYIFWHNAGNSSDSFEFRFVNDYTIGYFSFDMGEDSINQNARKITKNTPYIFIRKNANLNSFYDSYQPVPS
jgi:hypothetical protein